MKNRFSTLVLLAVSILAIFVARALLASNFWVPYTFHAFDVLTVVGSLFILAKEYPLLRGWDWLITLVLGLVVGASMMFATLFSPYPFLGLLQTNLGQAWIRGILTIIATLGGLVIMRQGGPVQFHAANGDWQNAGRGALFGLALGLPLAVVNILALQLTQGQPISWQNPLSALFDALQPGIVEEVTYRFAMWGMLWLILRNSNPQPAVWISGILATLVHGFAHFDDLFLQSPFMALGMGTAMTLLWGLPLFLLARRRGLESAIAFHWLQDVARFVTGF